MLIKHNEQLKYPAPTLLRYVGGKDMTRFGAYAHGVSIQFKMALPRILGSAAAVMRICRDGEGDRDIPFEFTSQGGIWDTYTLTLDTGTLCPEGQGIFFYEILLLRGLDTLFTSSVDNVEFTLEGRSGRRFMLLVHKAELMPPESFAGGIMYQIFPDRFFRGEGWVRYREDSIINEDWENGVMRYARRRGGPVKNNDFFGGNLWGVAEKLDYLASLGVDIIYLNPIFEAYSNHKYDTSSYDRVDSGFGGEAALIRLIDEAHWRGMKIVLDGVFNHTGDDSIYFDRYGRYGGGAYSDPSSKYKDWYFFSENEQGRRDYASWWGIKIHPKLNVDNESCREYLTGEGGIVEKYLRLGIDGWRLDVADELSDGFLDSLRARVKSVSPEAIIIGEVWENAAEKISYGKRRRYFGGDQLDSVMNYPFRSAVLDYAEYGEAELLARELTEIYASYPKCVSDCLMNILGTHDTERVLTHLGAPEIAKNIDRLSNDEISRLRLGKAELTQARKKLMIASALQYTVYGFPSIYYGDERGMQGHGDPFCRMPMVWSDIRTDRVLLEHYKRLGRMRQNEPIFAHGDFKVTRAEGGYLEFERAEGDECIRVGANMGETAATMKNTMPWYDIYSDMIGTGSITVPPLSFKIVKTER